MSNALKYIKSLEAAGFARAQAEAQVQMVLDVLEGDLVTKSDLAILQEKLDSRFSGVRSQFAELQETINARFSGIDARFVEIESRMDKRFAGVDARFVELESRMDKRFAVVDTRFAELELRLTTRLGLAIVTSSTVVLSVLGYLIKTN